MSRKWINGRNIVLSGCSTGIGRELCRQLVLKHGCNVMGIARNEEKLKSLKKELGDKFSYRRFDIGNKEKWQEFAKELETIGFNVDILINNAGMIQPFTAYVDLDDSQIEKINKTNYESILASCKVMIPYIKKSSYGGIINISSASSILPVAGEAIYSSSKFAVSGFTYSLFQELRGYGIFVQCVMPGPVKTDLYKARESEGEKGSKVKDNKVENIGLSAERAAQKIIGAIKRRSSRLVLGFTAKMMDLGARVAPVFTYKCTEKMLKKLGKGTVPSFAPIFAEQIERKDEIKALKKNRKKVTYSKNNCPKSKALMNDKV